MFSILKRLKKMPEYRRKLVAVFVSIFLVFLIFSGWLYSKTAGSRIFATEIVVENENSDANSPFSYISKNMKMLFSDVSGAIDKVKKINSTATPLKKFNKNASTTATSTPFKKSNKNTSATTTSIPLKNSKVESKNTSTTTTSCNSCR